MGAPRAQMGPPEGIEKFQKWKKFQKSPNHIMTPSSGRGDGKGTSRRTAVQSFWHRIMAEFFFICDRKKIFGRG